MPGALASTGNLDSGDDYSSVNRNKWVLKKRSETETTRRRKVIREMPPCVMTEIFSRLPAKSVLKLRCGCKSWNSILRGPYFARLQFKNGPNKRNQHAIIINSDNHPVISLYCYEAGKLRAHKLSVKGEALPDDVSKYCMSNSCNGLVCAFGLDNAFVINLCTGELVTLPKGSQFQNRFHNEMPLGGLVYDICRSEYKVVRLFRHKEIGVGFEILTLGSQSWRRSVAREARYSGPYLLINDVPVLLHGVLHWSTRRLWHPKVAITFDIQNETLGSILHPKSSDLLTYSPYIRVNIGELEGHLCICESNRAEFWINIWILEDYSKREWIKKYNIRFERIEIGYALCYFPIKPLTILRGSILILHGLRNFLYYDMENKSMYKIEDIPHGLCCVLHAESLISPSIDQNQADVAFENIIAPFACKRIASPSIQKCTLGVASGG